MMVQAKRLTMCISNLQHGASQHELMDVNLLQVVVTENKTEKGNI